MRTAGIAFCVASLLLAACANEGLHARHRHPGYFDPHNHLSGVLPWKAYANLPVYIDKLEAEGKGVSQRDELAFYTWLDNTWYAEHKDEFDDKPFSSGMRYGIGARATLELYPAGPDLSPATVSHALERIFTATPFTVFDNAYAFHAPAFTWLTNTYYDGDRRASSDALCTAQVLTLAKTDITRSEQSIGFIGGWGFDDSGHSYKLGTVMCAARKPGELKQKLKRLGEPVPRVRIILMTHTDQLGENAAGDEYKTFEGSGQCHWTSLSPAPKLSPEQMYRALIGEDKNGKSIVSDSNRQAFYDTLAGIDTAAPEMTCFTSAGMAYYQNLVDAVYRAAKVRREAGWTGKLLVHTHVGEGFGVYYAKKPPKKPWSFVSMFAQVPAIDGNIVTNEQAPQDNVSMLLDAVAQVRLSHPDLDRYVVIRFGHLTHATLAQARRLAKLHIEADVNLDSNIATGAWSFADMPDESAIEQRVSTAAADPQTNFELNNLPAFLIPNPKNADQVADVLGTHPLKYLLMAHARVMLGTDGAGVEHSSMPREYDLAASLIRYWKTNDPAFREQAGNASKQTFFNNADWHLANMATNAPLSY